MQLIIFGGFADGAYLVKQALEFAAAVSAPAVFDIDGLLQFCICRESPVILLQLAVSHGKQLRAIEESRGILLVFIGIASPVKLGIACEGDLFKTGAVSECKGIDCFNAAGDN